MASPTNRFLNNISPKAIVYSLFIFSCLFAFYLFASIYWDAYKDLKYFKAREQSVGQELQEVNEKLESSKKYLNRLETDPKFLRQVARQRLGIANEDEILFRFQTPKH